MKTLLVVVLGLFVGFSQCFAEEKVEEETAEDGLKAILQLYKDKDFEKLIKERYTEIYKAEEADKVDELVKKFSARFSDEKKLKKVIEIFEAFAKVTPELVDNPKPRKTETDKMANFPMEKGTYKLYLQKSGKWGFHL